jgi:hypothetical protein
VDAARCAGRTVVESQSGFDLRGTVVRVNVWCSLSPYTGVQPWVRPSLQLSHTSRGVV